MKSYPAVGSIWRNKENQIICKVLANSVHRPTNLHVVIYENINASPYVDSVWWHSFEAWHKNFEEVAA